MDPEVVYDKLADEYRAARLNVIYYGGRLVALQRLNTILEMVIAIGTSGSVASLALFQTNYGKVLFGAVVTISAVFGVLKPILALSKQIERVSKLWSGWNAHYYVLKAAVDSVALNHAITPDVEAIYQAAATRVKELAAIDDPKPDQKALGRIWEQVNREIPPESFPGLAA